MGMALRCDRRSLSSLVVDLVDLTRGGDSFWRLLPNVIPVNRRSRGSTCADNVKHELSPIATVGTRRDRWISGINNVRVLLRFAGPGSIPLEVADESGRIVSKVTEIDGLSALPQKQ